MGLAVVLHILSVVVWVGGMFFAWMILRPAAAQQLDGPHRLRLWSQVFRQFFIWVWLAIIVILASGYWMVFYGFGGFSGAAIYIHLMQAFGIIMMLIFIYLFFTPYSRFQKAVEAENFPQAAELLIQIRKIVGTNLILGLFTIVIAASGRYI